jgi:cell division protein FtsL
MTTATTTTGSVTDRRTTTGTRRPRTGEGSGTRSGSGATRQGLDRAGRAGRVHRSALRRPGSLQVTTVRGRRVATAGRGNRMLLKTFALICVVVAVGVAVTMYLSGKTTEQSFQLAEAEGTSDTLSDQIETLNRDVKEAGSTQHLAAEAARLGMVVPGQTGVLDADGNRVDQLRAPDAAKDRDVTDVNGDVTRSGPTSDPRRTGQVPGLVPSAPTDAAPAPQPAGAAPAAPPAAQAAPAGNGQLPY